MKNNNNSKKTTTTIQKKQQKMTLETRFQFLCRVQKHLGLRGVPFAANVQKPVPVAPIAFVCQEHGNVFTFKKHPLHPSCNDTACKWTYVGHLPEDSQTSWLMF